MSATSTSWHVQTMNPSGSAYAGSIPEVWSACQNGADRRTLCNSLSHFFAAWMANSPRYDVGQDRVSIRFAPIAINVAQGLPEGEGFHRCLISSYIFFSKICVNRQHIQSMAS